jgi:hypothetical protein
MEFPKGSLAWLIGFRKLGVLDARWWPGDALICGPINVGADRFDLAMPGRRASSRVSRLAAARRIAANISSVRSEDHDRARIRKTCSLPKSVLTATKKNPRAEFKHWCTQHQAAWSESA